MLKLWRWFCLRHLRSYKGRALLCLLGVALGVAVFVGIKTAASSALISFQDTVTSLSGKAQLQVVGQGNGFSEEIYTKVSSLEEVHAATPVLEFNVIATSPVDEPLLMLGIDVFSDQEFRQYHFVASKDKDGAVLSFLTEPGAIALTEKFAERHGLTVGDRLEILSASRRLSFTLRALLELKGPARALEGNLALVDIATAQEAFEQVGRLHRIDLTLAENVSPEEVRKKLENLLPPDVTVEPPQKRLGRITEMIKAYRLNLLALSLIALFVGIFLIYNAVAFAVHKRRYEIAMLRVLGTQKWQILGLFLGEALLVGLLGALIGVGLGLLMAKIALRAMAETISELYLLVRADTLSFSPLVIFLGAGAALGVALLGGLFPSLEASRTLPREALYRTALERRLKMNIGRITLVGALLLGAAYLFSQMQPVKGLPLFGFVAAFLILAGFSFLTPASVLLVNRALAPGLAGIFKIEGKMASRYLGRSLNRSAVAIASLMTALAMLISISIMILSFRQTVKVWTEQIISADLFISPAGRLTGQRGSLPPALVESLAKIPGLVAMERLTEIPMRINEVPALLFVTDLEVKGKLSRIMLRRGSSEDILRRCREQGQVTISEVLSNRLKLAEGDHLQMVTPEGMQSFDIAGVFYDYRTEGGMVIMDRSTYAKYWPEEGRYSSVALYLKPGSSLDETRSLIRGRLKRSEEVFITSNKELRREILRIFDQTFSITYALQIIAIVVAIFGIVNTLVLLVMERERDIGVLKAVGATNRQVQRMTLLEAGLMGLISFVLGAVNGILLSLLLIFVINKQSFGWTIQFSVPGAIFGKTLILVLACALIAGIFPARAAISKEVSEVMRLE
ncbi:MAG: FtsX-like permease family protein [Deltaproteobacteria bacterium]|nr:FtsX-like permease family protein [Deltaproteobacteria bacterium]